MKTHIELTVQVIGPDEELEAIGECYAIYLRRLSLDIPPIAGMIIALTSNLMADDSRLDEYARLHDTVELKPVHLLIERVALQVDMSNTCQVRVRAADIVEGTINGFKDLERLLTHFYGFDRIV
jgi:hypothetical protein